MATIKQHPEQGNLDIDLSKVQDIRVSDDLAEVLVENNWVKTAFSYEELKKLEFFWRA